MRLEELADRVSGSADAMDEVPAVETVPPLTPTDAPPVALAETPVLSVRETTPPSRGESTSGRGAGPIANDSSAERLGAFAATIARSLTESWSGVLKEVDCRAALDRSQLETGLAILDSLSGNVRALSGRLDDLSEETRTAHGNYQDAIGRLRDGEQRLAASETRLEQVDEGLCRALVSQEEIRTKMEAQAAATASLGQAARNQTEWIEAQVVPNLVRLNERLEFIAQTLQNHSDFLDRLGAAWSSTQAVQQSLQRGLDRQAEAIDAVRATTKAQVGMWAQLLEATTEFSQTAEAPSEGTTPSV